jgi:hypothetical protein
MIHLRLLFLGVSFAFLPLSEAALVARYGFEEGSGPFALDSAIDDGTPTPIDDGVLSGGPTFVAGRVGAFALDLDGSNAFVNLERSGSDNDLINSAGGVTLTAWINLDAFPSDIGSIIMLSRFGNSSESRAVLDITSTGAVEAGGRASDGETFRSRITSSPVTLGTWMHLAAVINYAADSVTIYVDGVARPLLAGSTNFTGTTTPNTNSQSSSIGSTAGAFEFINGRVDEVRIYNEALSANAIAATMVPEPAAAVLALLGSGALFRWRTAFRRH